MCDALMRFANQAVKVKSEGKKSKTGRENKLKSNAKHKTTTQDMNISVMAIKLVTYSTTNLVIWTLLLSKRVQLSLGV